MSAVLAFPDRGGAGWRADPTAKWGDYCMANVQFAAMAFWRKHGAAGYTVLGISPTREQQEAARLLQALAGGRS